MSLQYELKVLPQARIAIINNDASPDENVVLSFSIENRVREILASPVVLLALIEENIQHYKLTRLQNVFSQDDVNQIVPKIKSTLTAR
jgi:hypothetical protein